MATELSHGVHRRISPRGEPERQALEHERTAAASQLAGIGRKIDGLVDAIADGLRGAGLQQRLDDLEARKTELEAWLAGPEPPPVRLHPNLAQLYREKVSDLHLALADPAMRAEAFELIRGLIDRVELHPAEGWYRIELGLR